MSHAKNNRNPLVGEPAGSARAAGLAFSPPLRPAELSAAASVWHAFLLRKATQRVTAMAEAVLSPLGLTLRHFGVLSSVGAEPGQNQRIIGERLRIDRTTVVALTDDLEDAGLLQRRRGVDRRTFSLHLTDVGVIRLAELKNMMDDIHAEFLAPLSLAERAMLHDLLLKLTAKEGVR